jgi:TPR repeat protein
MRTCLYCGEVFQGTAKIRICRNCDEWLDEKKTLDKVLKAAEEGDTRAQKYLAYLLIHNNKPQAIEWYRKAAEQGDKFAQEKSDALVELLRKELDKLVNFLRNTAKWYRMTAEQGDKFVQEKLDELVELLQITEESEK